MRFCFFGYDFSLDIAQRLVTDGHTLLKIFTFPCDNAFVFNASTVAFADTTGIPFQDTLATKQDLDDLLNADCTVFLAAGYPYKIPQPEGAGIYALNIHPAKLPRARGIMPLPYILMNDPQAAGFTIHKMSAQFDAGDILCQESIAIDDFTDVEVLSSRIALRLPDVMSEVMSSLPRYWEEATPQDETKAGYYSAPSESFRSLDWNMTIDHLLKLERAFGRFGTLALIAPNHSTPLRLAVFQFGAWKENHTHACGTVLRILPREIVVAVKDGFVCLKDFQILTD